ncbi:flagellar biosynthesis repressor FlbT [Marivita sp. GX14005]|uniref:flagellar biosynthesis repressor FlbT n=1 Tax=Marivita sp. GX14005 TaxID=2942276 RepID=UPI0020199AB8|nr:flagellar biosynthesis repressor FlbT [Marivita sp. GX14005]MCL3881705.1 flagellar biosynthesis repressor FlbT [Marivita sp. GX14005]
MSGLVLKLSPKERIMINSAVIENGDRRSRFTVLSPKANILRLKDAIHPEDANTPVRRACYLAQLLLSGDVDASSVTTRLQGQIGSLTTVFQDDRSVRLLDRASAFLREHNAYGCLKSLRQLLPLEERLLSLSGK